MSNTSPQRDENATRKFNAHRALRNCGDLKAGLKSTAEVILDHVTNSTQYRAAWPSIARISHISGTSVRAIGDHIHILEGLGIYKVTKMGLREFREYAKKEYDMDVKAEHTGGSKHYMNLYSPNWSHGVFELADRGRGVRGGSLPPEGRELLKRLRLEVASGRGERAANMAEAAASNMAEAAASNMAEAADNLQSGKGRRAPLSRGALESNLVPPSAGPETDQTITLAPGDGDMTTRREATGTTATSPNPAKSHPRPQGNITHNPAGRPAAGQTPDSPSIVPAPPAADPSGFLRFLRRWEALAQSLPTWRPMDDAGRAAWAAEWDRSQELRYAADLVLDEAGCNPFLTGLKEGKKGAFSMQPSYLLKEDAKTGKVRYLLLATRSAPFFDYREPIDLRVKLLLRDHPADAASLVDSWGEFYPHERPRAAELLGEIARERADAASAKADKDGRASLLSVDLEDVRHRLAMLSSRPYDPIDCLPEVVEGLRSCPAGGGKELIAGALWDLVSYYNKWFDCEGHAEDLRAALEVIDAPKAEALRDGLHGRFEVADEFDEDPVMKALLGVEV